MFVLKKKSPAISAELKEEHLHVPLAIQGHIPSWLSGTLVRNGPIMVAVDRHSPAHWFDGLAMLHAFAFKEGQVSYSNKFLRSDAYDQVFNKRSIHYDGFATDPCRSLFKRFFTWFIPSSSSLHNANVNVAKLADQYVALTETPLPVRFDPSTLETLGVLDYQDRLPKDKCWESAHPHMDNVQQETVNYLIEYGRTSTYTLYRLKEHSSQRDILAKIPVQEPAYMHSFALTPNYVILTEFPFVVRPLDLITKGLAFIKNFSWHPERGTQFIVISRHTGQVAGTYKTKPFFAFHHANAFEKDEGLYLDIATYKDASIITNVADHFNLRSAEKEDAHHSSAYLERFFLSLQTGRISSYPILENPLEFPRINEAFDGMPYRYVYAIDARKPRSTHDRRSIYKIDVLPNKALLWSEEGCCPGEPVFVAAPGAKEEDEGVVLAVVLNQLRQHSFLLILDAKTFEEIGRAQVAHVIPTGLHGQYFAH